MVDPRRLREKMVAEQIEGRGVTDPGVLKAMREVPRHEFVQSGLAHKAYMDAPLPIGEGQTISQPYVVALMTEALQVEPDLKVLEIGTGSGYQTAVLAAMGADVYTVERIKTLFFAARSRFMASRQFNVSFKLDDGTMGWAEEAPFDRILVTAGGPGIPEPLLDQLADPGRLVIPVGGARKHQKLLVAEKIGGEVREHDLGGVCFVDLVGRHGW